MTARSAGQVRIKAPRADGAVLIDPPLQQADRLLQANRAGLAEQSEWTGLRARGREQMLALATGYTSSYLDLPEQLPRGDRPVILAGHQPHFFHPGVWFKNFVLSQAAHQCDAVAVNLVIDNDTAAPPSIRTPTGDLHDPRLAVVSYDSGAEAIPYEERGVLDREQFRSFADRLRQTAAPWLQAPLALEMWPDAIEAAERTGNLGAAAAHSRHRWEHRWGLRTLEVPLSQLCQSEAFLTFAWKLLSQPASFAETYNAELAAYRTAHRLRSRSHPVPDLVTEDGWQESPFWIWSADRPRRERLFVKATSAGVELTDRDLWQVHAESPAMLGEHLADVGIKLRPRALVTTMFARLVLSDLFLHGIGGAKYDELTDAIIDRFFGFQAPQYLTVSATCLLPVQRPDVSPADLRAVDRRLRDLTFHPETHALAAHPSNPTVAQLTSQKAAAVAREPAPEELAKRHQQIVQANAGLQPFVASQRQAAEEQRATVQHDLRVNRLLGSREFSYLLFPEQTLRPFLTAAGGRIS
ncbi:hypothetical protein [Lignipirellula cremea]|uniref:Uncharacterized protein n=1 Tax=Lignipirellula cremea TaxID=2528010 RepID=A0A518DV22_9BACT|nr:hypothetical protein [Lignipirellula cremea]QDU95686.1 hypothetical protein Pla8534_35030 [Lignipirellula cremea]